MDKEVTVFQDNFSEEIWSSTYKDLQDHSVNDTFKRVANSLASVEHTTELKRYWEKEFYSILQSFRVTAAGRIYSNAGTHWHGTTLINCFVGPRREYDIDSLDGILSVLYDQAQTLKSEGGWGMNFSFIRPRGSFIKGIGVESPGAVKYMELFDKSSDIITSGSGKEGDKKHKGKGKIRKGAMMGVLDCWHPDIEEFVTAKLTPNRLSRFNISANCNNEFMERLIQIKALSETCHNSNQAEEIEELNKWNLIFPDTTFEKYKSEWDGDIQAWKAKNYPYIVYKTVKITELWDLIIKSTYTRNDPGVLFLDRANQTHCWNYGGIKAKIGATNPCGEQTLPYGLACNLASLNLTQCINEDCSGFDLDKVRKYVSVAVRLLDNVNDYTNAPLDEYVKNIREKRRIGLGVMGWGSALYVLGIKFGSDKAERLKRELMLTFTHTAVQVSIELAKEKGMFKGCDPLLHAAHMFWKQIELPEHLLLEMARWGIRNSALFSCQPTGNTAILANIVSGGIEPVFLPEYIRTVICNEVPEHIKSWCPKYWEGEFKETDLFKFAKEGDTQILRAIKDGVTYKIDKTRGLTKEVLCEDYGVRYLKSKGKWNPKADWAVTTESLSVDDHLHDMVGWGKWIDSSISKTVNVTQDYPFEDFQKLYLRAYESGVLKGVTTYRAGTMTTVLANKDTKVEQSSIIKTKAPKRPDKVNAQVHHLNINGIRYVVCVGLIDKDPYEVFVFKNHDSEGDRIVPKSVNEGYLTKKSRGSYFLQHEKESYPVNNFNTEESIDVLTRILSTALRHGADISFIVHQLEKTKGAMTSFSKCLARTLKKYIPDGTKVSGANCPQCSKELIRSEGCLSCKSCGWSKCG